MKHSTTQALVFRTSHVFGIVFIICILSSGNYCKDYFVTKKSFKNDEIKTACSDFGDGTTVAKQCEPNNLANMVYDGDLNGHIIWIKKERAACGPMHCLAIRVNNTATRNVTLICSPCTDENLVMCETDSFVRLSSKSPRVEVHIFHTNLSTCNMSWIRRGDQEFMVVMAMMSFRFATMYCVAVLHGQTLLDISYTYNDISFLNLPSSTPYFWISTAVQGNLSYAHVLLPNGDVKTERNEILSESICQREYRTTVPPPTTPTTSKTTLSSTTKVTSSATTSVSTTSSTTTTPTTTTPTTTSTTTTPTTTPTTTTPTTTPSTTTPTTTPSTTTPTTPTPTITPTTTKPTTTTLTTTKPPTTTPTTTTPTTTLTTTTPTTTQKTTTHPTQTTTTPTKTTMISTLSTSITATLGTTKSSTTPPTSTISRLPYTTSVMPTAPKDPEWIQYRFAEYYVNPNNMTFAESQQFCQNQMNATLVFFYQIGMYIQLVKERMLNISSGSFWVASGMNPNQTKCFNIDVNAYKAILYGLDMDCRLQKGSICARAIRHNSTEDLVNAVMTDPKFVRMIEEMTVKKNTTGRSLRKLISVRDHHAEQAGTAVSIVLVVSSFAFFILCDLTRIKGTCRKKQKTKTVKGQKEKRRRQSRRESEV